MLKAQHSVRQTWKKVEQGEDILVAAIREVREESGLVVNPQTVRLVGKFTG